MQIQSDHFFSFSGYLHSLPGVYRSKSQSSFLLCMLLTKFFCDPFAFKSLKKRSTAFMATLSVDTGQITQLQPQSLKVLISMQGVLPNSVIFASKQISFLWSFKALATTLNSSAVSKPSGKIISAPASMQAFDRVMHSSSPQTPLASVLAQTMNCPSDTFCEAYLAILILSTICRVGISSLPFKWPHLLGNTWSSI